VLSFFLFLQDQEPEAGFRLFVCFVPGKSYSVIT